MAMFPLLQENEGVIVHHDGNGFIVAKVFDEEYREIQVKIMHDDSVLQQEDRRLVWLHNEPVGNAQMAKLEVTTKCESETDALWLLSKLEFRKRKDTYYRKRRDYNVGTKTQFIHDKATLEDNVIKFVYGYKES